MMLATPELPSTTSASGRSAFERLPLALQAKGLPSRRPIITPRPATLNNRLRIYASSGSDEERFIVDIAASSYAKGVNAGEDPDELVAQQLGALKASQMSDVQERYKDKIKVVLETRAEELRREKEARAVKFAQGKNAYARGQYPASVVLLEEALNEEGPFTQLGGEIQMWLALAYQACGREKECIATYKAIEGSHPMPAVRRQAASLRYIMEAPKLEISPEEKVSIPLLNDLDPNKKGRTNAPRPRAPVKKERPKTWDEEFWEDYTPPSYLSNKYVWAAVVVLLVGLAWYSTHQTTGL